MRKNSRFMRRGFLAASAVVFSCAASAQSDVAVFGVADVNVRSYTNGSSSVAGVGSGGYAASRLGFRAGEDISGGLKALAWMEGTVNFDDGTGNSSRLWNRRSTLSLIGSLGELRLGHDLTPGYTSFGEFDTFGVSGMADQGKFYSSSAAVFGSGIDATGVWARADGMLSYFTPDSLCGFYANVAVSPDDRAPAKKYRGARIGYAATGLNVTGAYSVFSGIAGNLVRSSLAMSYELTSVKFYGSLVRNHYLAASRLVAQVGVVVPVSQNGKIRANYTAADASGTLNGASIDGDDAAQIALGYTHDLSRRTTLYATYVDLRNKGKAAFAVSTPPAMQAGGVSRGAEIGISHSF